VNGKTVTESFASEAARRKAQREVSEFHRFQQLSRETPFAQGREQLELLAGLRFTTKAVGRQAEALGADIAAREQAEIERAKQLELPAICAPAVPVFYIEMDGAGVPVVKAETAVRDEASTTYTGAIETAEEFGLRIYTEAWRRGWSRAQKKVVIGDGAPWIWNLAAEHFPGAVKIVDLYHAREHLWKLSAKLFPLDERQRKRWTNRLQKKLDQGQIEALVKILRQHFPPDDELAHLLANEADYFERNADRMRYPDFRQQGLFVGSGVIEAGCRSVIGDRLKRSGMFWTVAGANAIIALRCCRLSGRFEDYWENRSAA